MYSLPYPPSLPLSAAGPSVHTKVKNARMQKNCDECLTAPKSHWRSQKKRLKTPRTMAIYHCHKEDSTLHSYNRLRSNPSVFTEQVRFYTVHKITKLKIQKNFYFRDTLPFRNASIDRLKCDKGKGKPPHQAIGALDCMPTKGLSKLLYQIFCATRFQNGAI